MVKTAEELYEGSDEQHDEGAGASESQEVSSGDATSQVDAQAQQPTETVGQPGEGGPEDLTRIKKALAASRDDTKAERKARREAEQRLADREKRLAALENPQERQKPVGPEDLENEFFERPGEFFQSQQQKFEQQMEAMRFQIRAEISKARVARENEDYQEAEAAFNQAAQQAPWLWQQVYAHEDPAAFVLSKGRELLGRDESTVKVQTLEAEIAELKAQLSGQVVPQQARPTIPKSNAGARGSSVGKRGAWSGPPTAEQLYGD